MTPNRPYNGGDRPYHNKGKTFGPRKNERIRAPKIRVIGPDGKQLGIMTPQEALSIARRNRLDLLEVSPDRRPAGMQNPRLRKIYVRGIQKAEVA